MSRRLGFHVKVYIDDFEVSARAAMALSSSNRVAHAAHLLAHGLDLASSRHAAEVLERFRALRLDTDAAAVAAPHEAGHDDSSASNG